MGNATSTTDQETSFEFERFGVIEWVAASLFLLVMLILGIRKSKERNKLSDEEEERKKRIIARFESERIQQVRREIFQFVFLWQHAVIMRHTKLIRFHFIHLFAFSDLQFFSRKSLPIKSSQKSWKRRMKSLLRRKTALFRRTRATAPIPTCLSTRKRATGSSCFQRPQRRPLTKKPKVRKNQERYPIYALFVWRNTKKEMSSCGLPTRTANTHSTVIAWLAISSAWRRERHIGVLIVARTFSPTTRTNAKTKKPARNRKRGS